MALLKFQDALYALTKAAAADEHPILTTVRKNYPGHVFHITLTEAASVYEGCAERRLHGHLADPTFRRYVDFLNMQGAIMHSNDPALEELLIVDPMWLLKTVTRVVREP